MNEVTEKKAYDVKDLVEKLKGHGLELAEESCKVLISTTLEWVEESAKISHTPYDDIALIVMPQLKKFIFDAVEKINPKG
jgi:hypothetical protein